MLHTVLLVIRLLFLIVIICYHYAKIAQKQNNTYCDTKNIKKENDEF